MERKRRRFVSHHDQGIRNCLLSEMWIPMSGACRDNECEHMMLVGNNVERDHVLGEGPYSFGYCVKCGGGLTDSSETTNYIVPISFNRNFRFDYDSYCLMFSLVQDSYKHLCVEMQMSEEEFAKKMDRFLKSLPYKTQFKSIRGYKKLESLVPENIGELIAQEFFRDDKTVESQVTLTKNNNEN